MYLSFGRRLRGFGRMRIGAGIRMNGWVAAFMIFIYAMLYMCWYMVLGTLWLMYGLGYVFYYLPIKGIVKLCRRNKANNHQAV